MKPKIGIGFRIGKLTVSEPTGERKNGYMVWNCTCDCGGAVQLDTRTLQRGTVRDCGCETKVKPGQKDLTGQRFGRLVCLEPSPHRNKQGGTQWLCQCDCGKQCLAATHQLLCGYKKSCGCLSHPPLKDYVGKRFGMLTVLEYAGKRDGMHRWRCLCDCGKQCLAATHQLLCGYKKSCGCLSHPPLKDYVGKRLGMLTVLEYAGKWDSMHRWRCLCDCGNETIVGQTLLQSGRTKSCGCNGSPPMEDLTGKVFGKLTVLELAEWKSGTSYWLCRCECGNETKVRYAYLISGHTKSCGCLQNSIIKTNMKFVDGTSVTLLEKAGKRLLKNNSSGYNGVYLNRRTQKWTAQIGFKGKNYNLGSFSRIEDAVDARKKAEDRIYGEFLEWYYQTYQKKPVHTSDVEKTETINQI